MIDLFLEGFDGSRWDLIRGPVRVVAEGTGDLLMPAPEEIRVRETSQRDGQERTGGRTLARYEPFSVLAFLPRGSTASDFWQLYRAWHAALSSKETSYLVSVNTDTGEVARLGVSVSKWPGGPRQDPSTSKRFALTYEVVAHDPFWYLPTVSMEFPQVVEEPEDYYGGGPITDGPSVGGYPLVRGTGVQSGRVEVENPGTEPAWWIARFPASSSSFLVSVDGRTVAGSFPVPDGSIVEVDAQQSAVWVIEGGRRTPLMWGRLDRVEFAPLPPGRAADVRIQSVGAGTPSFTFWPRRREAL